MPNIDAAKMVLDHFTDQLAQGNEGGSDIEEFDLDNTTLKFKVDIHHYHRVKGPFGGKITVYSMHQTVSGRINIINPSDYDIDTCIKSPVGDICFDVDDLIKNLIPFLV